MRTAFSTVFEKGEDQHKFIHQNFQDDWTWVVISPFFVGKIIFELLRANSGF